MKKPVILSADDKSANDVEKCSRRIFIDASSVSMTFYVDLTIAKYQCNPTKSAHNFLYFFIWNYLFH